MLTQMQRRELELAAEDLVDALDSSWDTFQVIATMFDRAKVTFIQHEYQPDPESICVALQAQALAVITLAKWCKEVGSVLSVKYYNAGESMLDKLTRELDKRGVILPPY
jgi:hypothetical protein